MKRAAEFSWPCSRWPGKLPKRLVTWIFSPSKRMDLSLVEAHLIMILTEISGENGTLCNLQICMCGSEPERIKTVHSQWK